MKADEQDGTKFRERAAGKDETVRNERAGPSDEIVDLERAVPQDETVFTERADALDGTVARERPDWYWVRAAVEAYYDHQQVRMAATLRLKKPNGADKSPPSKGSAEGILEVLGESRTWEARLQRAIEKAVESHPMWPHLVAVRGIGPILAAGIISFIESFGSSKGAEIGIRAMVNPSILYRYAGLAVIDGRMEKRKKGEKAHYSTKFRTLCWKIGESFVKGGGFYRRIYDAARADYDRRWTPWCGKEHMADGKRIQDDEGNAICFDAHRFAAAKRKAVKIFLGGVWYKWRTMEGLDAVAPYAIEKMGHKTFYALPEVDEKITEHPDETDNRERAASEDETVVRERAEPCDETDKPERAVTSDETVIRER